MFQLHSLNRSDFPSKTFILNSPITKSILFQPNLAGKELQDLLDESSVMLAKAIHEVALEQVKRKQVAEVVLLAGGLFYGLNYGFKKAFNFSINQCFLGVKRFNEDGGWVARAAYENFEALPDNPVVLIGDTIAGGTTIDKAVSSLEKALGEKNYSLKKLVICSLACSSKGGQRIASIEKRIKQKWPGCEVFLIACEEFFHVMPDGTDLRFLREDAVVLEETRQAVLEAYGPWLGREMKCAVFDWGTRCKQPEAHYREFLHYVDGALKQGGDGKAKAVLGKMREKTGAALAGLDTQA